MKHSPEDPMDLRGFSMSVCIDLNKEVVGQGDGLSAEIGERFFYFAYCFQQCFMIIYCVNTFVHTKRTNAESGGKYYGKSL